MTNPQELPATASRLKRLAQNGYLDETGLEQALTLAQVMPNQTTWRTFLDYSLLMLGALFTLSGILFFFAYNWADIPHLAKFGLIQAGILLSIGIAHYRGLHAITGQVGLFSAAVLVGAHLAVQGQIYQTGADAYTLFLGWLILITGWAMIGQSSAIWLLWLSLLNLTTIFYWEQVVNQLAPTDPRMFQLLFIFNGLAWLLSEIGHRYQVEWMQARWFTWTTALLTIGSITWPILIFIMDDYSGQTNWVYLTPPLYIGFTALISWLYSQQFEELPILTMNTFSLIAVITTAIANQAMEFDDFGGLIVGVAIIIQVGLAVTWLRYVDKSWEVA